MFFFINGIPLLGQTFHPVTTSITPVSNSAAAWADINNDGWPDLLVSGTDQLGTSALIYYENNGDSSFNRMEIVQLSQLVFDLADYNHDGFIDVLVAGKAAADEKVVRVYRNNSGGSFTAMEFGLEGITQGDVLWVDLDRNADLEIVVSGLDAAGEEVLNIYTREGSDYVLVPHTIPPLAYGNLLAFDANKDGLVELLLSGYDALGNPTTRIYSFDQTLGASLYTEGMDGYTLSRISQADINEDGYTDLVVSGITEDFEKAINVYINNQVNGFTRENSMLDSLGNAALTLGDLNNDGLTDLALMGLDEEGNIQSHYYVNTCLAGTSRWLESSDDFEQLYSGSIAIADFNLDGSLDLFQTGNSIGVFKANLYSSDIHLTQDNHPTAIPTGLSSITNQDQVTLSWSESSDDFTSTASLSYNVYISRETGGADLVLAPMSKISTGYRQLSCIGNAQYMTQYTVNNLSEGRYYWNVQAIDNAFHGSAFADEEEFVICDPIALGKDTAVCYHEIITLEAGAIGDDVNWYSLVQEQELASGSLTYDHLVMVKDTLVAEVTRQDLGCVLYDTFIIDVKGQVVLDLGADFSVCSGDTTQLDLNGFESVNWYTEDGLVGSDQETISFLQTDKDTVVAEVFFGGGCVQYDTVVIDLHAPVEFDLGKDTALCTGDLLPLVLEDFESVNWYLGSVGLVENDSEVYPYQANSDDLVIAEGIDVNGCSGFDTIAANALPLPEIDLGSDMAVCFGSSIELKAEGFEGVNWYLSGLGLLSEDPLLVFEVLENDTVIVEVLNESGCQNSDTLIIEVLPLPEVDLGTDIVVCEGETVLFQQQDPSFERVDWYDQLGSVVIEDQWFYTHLAKETDTLIALVTDVNGCVNSDTVIINVDPLPVFQLPDTTVCAGTDLKLFVGGNWDEVNWYTSGVQVLAMDQSEYTFNTTTSMTIWVEAIQNGCPGYDTLEVTVNPLPVFDLGESHSYCVGDQISLGVDGIGVEYTWRNSALDLMSSQPNLNVEAIMSDRYALKVIDAKGCAYEDSVAVTVHPLPEVVIEGVTEVCASIPVNLYVDDVDFESIRWYDTFQNTLGESQNLEYILAESGPVYVRMEDANHCVGQDTVAVVVHSLPVTDAGEDQFICFETGTAIGGSYDGMDDLVFRWEGGETLSTSDVPNPFVEPIESSWYFLEVTDEKDCVDRDSVHIEVNPQIIVDAGPDLVYCLDDEITIGGNPSASGSLLPYEYQWSPAEGLSSLSVPNPLVSSEKDQTYVLSVTSGDCEVASDTVNIKVQAPPEVVVSPTQSIGAGESVRLQATGGDFYRWAPAELLDNAEVAEPLATPFKSTTFTVEVEDARGCVTRDTVIVLVQNNLFIPNLFTPNGDGNNDHFKVYGSGIDEIRFSVYDLNGQLLYSSTQPDEVLAVGWDGNSQGRPVINGTYVWTIEGTFFDGMEVLFNGQNRGTVKLLR